ncbi:MAG: carboxypeptidase-like regulatory domain-containing protein, partial [Bacteroidales bacterium]|nr:carboxypeptidase-like regulatory domain-containing protein [Bacteroidales bacterium]
MTLALLVGCTAAFAQSTVKGTVKDAAGEPVIGAAVQVAGTHNGTITEVDGSFAPPGVRQGDKLEVSCIGYATQTITWNGGAVNVILEEDALMLEGTVVTALGITREKKTLGYAIQDVKGESLVDARESNLANALTGKVAGLSIVRSSNGPGASSRIVLRGNNSLTGLNQPLIVVDGVPMDNFVGASNNDFWNPSADMGSGLQDINPEDVESMT